MSDNQRPLETIVYGYDMGAPDGDKAIEVRGYRSPDGKLHIEKITVKGKTNDHTA